MMALNRYRLRHLAERGNTSAKLAANLLARPDRILGVILIGNTLANVAAASLATMLAVQYWGAHYVWLATLALTFVLLFIAEILPKTLAANYPEAIGFKVVWLLPHAKTSKIIKK